MKGIDCSCVHEGEMTAFRRFTDGKSHHERLTVFCLQCGHIHVYEKTKPLQSDGIERTLVA